MRTGVLCGFLFARKLAPYLTSFTSTLNRSVGSLRRAGTDTSDGSDTLIESHWQNGPNYLTIEPVAVKIARLPRLASAVPLCMS